MILKAMKCGTYHDLERGISLSKATLGKGVVVYRDLNAYGCHIGSDTSIGAFVEIQRGVIIGDKCKIQSHSFICEGVTLGDQVFVGHNVTFTNDDWPRACTPEGRKCGPEDWGMKCTQVCCRASIGSGAVIRGGVTIGIGAMVGAGAVVVHDVPDWTVVVGNPARFLRACDRE